MSRLLYHGRFRPETLGEKDTEDQMAIVSATVETASQGYNQPGTLQQQRDTGFTTDSGSAVPLPSSQGVGGTGASTGEWSHGPGESDVSEIEDFEDDVIW